MSNAIKPETIQVIEQRHSVKSYEKGYQIPQEDMDTILTAANDAPSAWNLQHWKFLVIDDEAKKQELLPIAYNQSQVSDSSFVVAILADLEANKNAGTIYDAAVEGGALTQEIRDSLVAQIDGAYQSAEFARDSANVNSSFAAMNLMLAAKALGYDTCAMGGFDKNKFAEHFNVPARYIPTILISVGKAAKPAYASGRFDLTEAVIKNSF
ncbi:nitroreductase family protein [Paenibacillus sp. PK4536]|uniref:Oxygen-insensitive NADPH nitroreductase n=1 Tax=Paenibacillus nuruki TaxID=1886670 RepID=A0A1E3L0A4_9BACL|nr:MULTISPECIES: nitroreductase family protein [Paenibacillus]ODP26400.1 Oxygen-insensitive NADPH nitroreductase [Paenibacillus nuruki]TKJ84112.1 nitroreductase family protein [Paenibacillus sp. CFBP13512]WIM40730.1 nitroreductase family protein [Paenibacillus sp. PK4536]CAJ1316921.1 Oxygen-insensitive NADPH nitroreductase [Paenibacillus nuruki]